MFLVSSNAIKTFANFLESAFHSLMPGVSLSGTLEILYWQMRVQLVLSLMGTKGGWMARKQWKLAENLLHVNGIKLEVDLGTHVRLCVSILHLLWHISPWWEHYTAHRYHLGLTHKHSCCGAVVQPCFRIWKLRICRKVARRGEHDCCDRIHGYTMRVT